MGRIQKELFELDQIKGFLYVSTPTLFFFLVWAWLLLWSGQSLQVARTVGPVVLLTTIGLLPVYRFRQSRKEAKIPFKQTYPIWGVVVAIQQILIVRAMLEV
jgi:hypothetical protein